MIAASRVQCMVTVCFVALGCKPNAATKLDDYAPGKTEYLGEITNGRGYLHFDPFENSAKPPLTDRAQKHARNLQQLKDLLSGPTMIDGVANWRKDWYLTEIRHAAINQIKYAITGLSQSEMGAAFNKLEITSFSIPESSEMPTLPFLDEPENYIEVRFSARITIQAPSSETVTSPPLAWAPILVHDHMNRQIYERYGACITYKGDDPEFYKRALFYYFDPRRCDIQSLNKEHGLMKPVEFILKKIQAPSHGGQPEYDQIWKDGKLVATFVFGVYEEFSTNKKMDPGTVAYQTFLKSLSRIRSLKKQETILNDPYNFRAVYQVTEGPHQKSVVDIQAVHVEEISQVSPEEANTLFGKRVGKHDLFVYNGHSGYGNNIKHVQKLLSPANDEYVLFFLNGCYTYSYNNLKNDNFDVISNMKPSLFKDMSASSLTVLQGLILESNYETILTRLPSYQSSIISGEQSTCPKPEFKP